MFHAIKVHGRYNKRDKIKSNLKVDSRLGSLFFFNLHISKFFDMGKY